MSFNKKLLSKETKQARITPPVIRKNPNVNAAFFMDPTALLPESFAQPIHPMFEDGGPHEDSGVFTEDLQVKDQGLQAAKPKAEGQPPINYSGPRNYDNLLDEVYSKYPALTVMKDDLGVIGDTGFTREATGIGDIEFFSPETIATPYPTGLLYPHPNPGGYGIPFNPKTNDAQSIALDMLHGMPHADSKYAEIKKEFGDAYMSSVFGEDFKRDVNRLKEEVGEDQFNEWYDGDSDVYFDRSYLDGIIRSLLFEGTPEDFEKHNYRKEDQEMFLSDPKLKEAFDKLKGYLITEPTTPDKYVKAELSPNYEHGGPHTQPLDAATLQTAISHVASANSVGIDGIPDLNINSYEQIYPELRSAVQERYDALSLENGIQNTSMAPLEYAEGGDIKKPGDGWEYKQEGDNYLTRKEGRTDWIIAKDTATSKARTAIQTKVFGVDPNAPVVNAPIPVMPTVPARTVPTTPTVPVAATPGMTPVVGPGTTPDVSATPPAIPSVTPPVTPGITTPAPPVQVNPMKQELKAFDESLSGDVDYVKNVQHQLIDAGYDLGEWNKNEGADGVYGPITQSALESYNSGISPANTPKPVRPARRTSAATPEAPKFKVAENLQPGVLPLFGSGTSHEVCSSKTGCAGNTYGKMANILGDILPNVLNEETGELESPTWGKNAWFNKDFQLKNGGLLLFDTEINDPASIPVEMYDKFQVGDYVHMNRGTSGHEGETSEDGYTNDQNDHIGFIIGKDTDGTPLVWHGSGSGDAFVQRIDGEMVLDDYSSDWNEETSESKKHDTIFKYKITSVVRNKNLIDNPDLAAAKLGESGYYEGFNEENKLISTKNATLKQKDMAEVVNSNIEKFQDFGFKQDDIAYVGQLLVGGIMGMETTGGESNWAPMKEGIAITTKDWFGIDPSAINIKYEGDALAGDAGLMDYLSGKIQIDWDKLNNSDPEASRGIYQMKPETNFKDADGNANINEQMLNKLGYSFDDLKGGNPYQLNKGSQNSRDSARTAGGMIMLLNYYDNLKKDEEFNEETNMYKGKIPASYILAKSWQMGPGWYKNPDYKEILENLDVDYSRNALDKAINAISVGDAGKDMAQEAADAKALKEKFAAENAERERIAYYNSPAGKEEAAKKEAYHKAMAEYEKKLNPRSIYYEQPAESTGGLNSGSAMPVVNNPYNEYGGDIKTYPHGGNHVEGGLNPTTWKGPVRSANVEGGKNPTVWKGGLRTYKDNPEYFDNKAVYHDNPEYNEQIRQRVYNGTHGYNPTTGELVKLKPEQQAKVDPQVKKWATQSKEELQQEREIQAAHQESLTQLDRQGKVAVQVPKEAAWNPLDPSQAGKTLYMSQEEADAFNKKMIRYNMSEVQDHPLWTLPGMVATGAFGPSMTRAGLTKAATNYIAKPYSKIFSSSKGVQKVLNPVINKYTQNSPKINKALNAVTKNVTIDNFSMAKATAGVPFFYNQYQRNPTWQNAGLTGLAATGFLPGLKYAKNLIGKGGRYSKNVVGANSTALVKYQPPNVNLTHNPARSAQLNNTAYTINRGGRQVGELSGNIGKTGSFETQFVDILPQFQKQGFGKAAYRELNKGVPGGVFSTGNFVGNNVKPGHNLWESMVKSGEAQRTGSGYSMLPFTSRQYGGATNNKKGGTPIYESLFR